MGLKQSALASNVGAKMRLYIDPESDRHRSDSGFIFYKRFAKAAPRIITISFRKPSI